MRPRRPAARPLALLLAVPLALAACGGDDEVAAPVTPDPSTSVEGEPSAPPAATPGAPSAAGGTPTPVGDLAPGDCFADIATGLNEAADVPVVPCAQPHANEVFAVLQQPDGNYPGPEEVQGLATEGCVAEFETYVGTPFGASDLDVFPVTPTAESWEQGDRRVLCVLTSAAPRSGSARGSGA